MARFVGTKLNYIPVALVGIGLAVVAYSMYQNGAQPGLVLRRQQSSRPLTAPDPGKQLSDLKAAIQELQESRDSLKEQIDTLNHDAANTQWLLSMVLLVAGLLTVAQGVFAFFSAQNYVKQADDAVARASRAVAEAEGASKDVRAQAGQAIQQIEQLAADVRTKFPFFADIESARADAFEELVRLSPAALDLDQNLYAKSDALARQRLFAIEGFSAVQFLTPHNRSAELISNLRLLGKFYAGKFLTERYNSDFERAYYYFDLAQVKSRRNYAVLNDLGWLFTIVADPPNPDMAKALFDESLRQNDNQQRALYNLGTVLFDRSDQARLRKAMDLLLKAREIPLWEDTPNSQMASYISYNLACVANGLAGFEADTGQREKLLDECMRYLEEAHAKAPLRSGTLKPDLARGGDLDYLAASSAHAGRLHNILAAI